MSTSPTCGPSCRTRAPLMGIGRGFGKTRARDAALAAVSSPLLDFPIERARGVVFTITVTDAGSNCSLPAPYHHSSPTTPYPPALTHRPYPPPLTHHSRPVHLRRAPRTCRYKR